MKAPSIQQGFRFSFIQGWIALQETTLLICIKCNCQWILEMLKDLSFNIEDSLTIETLSKIEDIELYKTQALDVNS